MQSACPECGAPETADDNCTDRFYRFLAIEMNDPEYGAVHHLTVVAYMLQHPSRLSSRGWQAMWDVLSQALDQELSPQALRARMREEAANQRRTWSLVKGPRLRVPPGFTWTSTILSVDDSTPAQYRRDIERWARQALADAAALEDDA